MENIKEKLKKKGNMIYFENEGKVIAYVSFSPVSMDTFSIDHTVVDESLRGQGIAALLVEAALDEIKSRNAKAIATCSYAKKYFEKHGIN